MQKCRLRTENVTRWSSAYLVLESVKRAYDKQIFNEDDLKCPISLFEVETYLQILAPAYRVSLGFQKNTSTIADVIPSILKLQSVWEKMNLSPTPKRFCNLLILTTQLKFDFEFNSDAYMVSYRFNNFI